MNQQISQLALAQYSDFYSMPTGSAPKEHIEAPKKHEIKSATPTTIFFGYQTQAVPYTQYQTYATYTGGNSLWIQGSTSWSQYAIVPQGAILSILATTSTGGNGYLYEINPNGQLYKNSFYFYPGYNQINFYADTVGQHILLFVIGSQVSNAIVIDVIPYYPPTYYQQPYQQINYPSYYTQGNPVTVYYSVEQPPKGSKTPSTAASSTLPLSLLQLSKHQPHQPTSAHNQFHGGCNQPYAGRAKDHMAHRDHRPRWGYPLLQVFGERTSDQWPVEGLLSMDSRQILVLGDQHVQVRPVPDTGSG